MLIRDLVKFANDLDASGLKKEADTVDVIIGAIKKLLEERGSGKDPDGSEEGQKESESEEIGTYPNRNATLPGALHRAFLRLYINLRLHGAPKRRLTCVSRVVE